MSEVSWVCLIRIKGPEGYRSHMIAKPSFTIGRNQDADLPIVHPSISRSHLTVDVQADSVIITDHKSANGTYVNERKLQHGVAAVLKPGDLVRLGNSTESFNLFALPKPFELLNMQTQQDSLRGSMEKISEEYEKKLRGEFERELRQERAENEKTLSKMKLELEYLKTQEKAGVEARKRDAELEIAKLLSDAAAVAAADRLKGAKEADLLIAEAQTKVQKDLEDSSRRAEALLKDTYAKCASLMEDAETKGRNVLNEAREEAASIRATATDRAHQIQRDATRKSDELRSQLQQEAQAAQQKLAIEMADKKEAMLAETRRELDREREIWEKNQEAKHETLVSAIRSLTDQHAVLKKEVDTLEKTKRLLDAESASVRDSVAAAKKLLSQTEDLEKRREQAERLLRQFTEERESRIATLDAELKTIRDHGIVEIEKMKKELENDVAKDRLKAKEDVQAYLSQAEAKYEKTRHMRAVELTQSLNEKILPQLSEWLTKPETFAVHLKEGIESAVHDVMIAGRSTIQAAKAAEVEEKSGDGAMARKWKKIYGAAAAVVLVMVVFHKEIWSYLDLARGKNFAATLIERRQIQSIYTPEQTAEFRDSYTDNILFKKGYFELKADSSTIEKWTIKLNDLDFVKSKGLSEEDMIRFVALETNLVQRLGALRKSIDAVYLTEGLERMRKAEAEGISEIMSVVRGEANYKAIRNVEKKFLSDLAKK